MRRTQIYLPQGIYDRLALLKQATQFSMAEIIRTIIEKHIADEEAMMKESLEDLADLKITGGPVDLSENFNSYLARK